MKDENLANFIAGCLRAGKGNTIALIQEFGMARILNSLAEISSDEELRASLMHDSETQEKWRKTQILLHQAAAIWAPERKEGLSDPLYDECIQRFLKRLPTHQINALGEPPRLRVLIEPGIVSHYYAKESNGRYEPGDKTFLPELYLGSNSFEHCSALFACFWTYLAAAKGLFSVLWFEFPGGRIPCGLAVPED